MPFGENEVQEITKFLDATRHFWPSYRTVHKKAFIMKDHDNPQLFFCTYTISSEPLSETEGQMSRVILDHSPFHVIHEIDPYDNIEKIISEIESNQITINGLTYSTPGTMGDVDVLFSDRYLNPMQIYGKEVQMYRLSFEPLNCKLNPYHEWAQQLDNACRINHIPFDGGYRLGTEFFHLNNRYQIPSNFPFILINALDTIGISNSTRYLEEGLYLKIWVDNGLKAEAVRVDIADYTTTNIRKSRTVYLDEEMELEPEGTTRWFENFIEPPDYEIVESALFLNFDIFHISILSIYNPHYQSTNHPLQALQEIDDNLRHFRNGLSGEPPKSFERCIALLFGLCNFKTLDIGGIPGLTDAADLIVLDPFIKRGLIVESTTDHLAKKRKLGNFIQRYDIMRLIFSDYELLPVMCTSLHSHELTEVETTQASENKIIVLPYEGIVEIFEYSRQNNSSDFIYNYIKNLQPQQSSWQPPF